jgi:predicted ATPase
MRTLTHLSLENFRLFKEKTSFDLAPITILTGTNSSGKSSLIKAILLLKENFEKNKSIEEIDFSIGDHNLNDFKNSLNYDSDSNIMYFSFSSLVNDLGVEIIELGYQIDSNNDSKGNPPTP